MPRLRTLLALAPVTLVAQVAYAHEATDPVCGMKVNADEVEWKAAHGGQTYHFCSDACFKSFVASPETYVGTRALHRAADGLDWTATVLPKDPRADDTSTFVVRVTIDGKPVVLSDAVAALYRVERDLPVEPDRRALHSVDDGNGLACHFRFAAPGEFRVLVEGRREAERVRTVFTIPVGSAPGAEEPPPVLADGEPLAMERQHKAMRFVGSAWEEARTSLDSGTPDKQRVLAALDRADRASSDLFAFHLHKNAEQMDEMTALAREFKGELARIREQVVAGRSAEAALAARATEANSCVRCHLKFRWDAVRDLATVPTKPTESFRSSAGREYLRLPTVAAAARPVVGDPAAGRRIYATHCLSCHGAGDGFGPGAELFPVCPRDHTDPVAMNARTDQQLFTAVKDGGRGATVNRSHLMPPFEDRFEDLDVWDVVAYVRTLAPRLADLDPSIEEAHARLSVLERPNPRGQFVDYLALRRHGESAPTAAAAFSQPDPEGRLVGVVVRDGSPPVARAFQRDRPIDALPTAEETESIAAWLLAGRSQTDRDSAKAVELAERLASKAQSVTRGQWLFSENCAKCHGLTGALAGPGISGDVNITGNLTDPRRHHRDPAKAPEAHIRDIVERGSGALLLSGNMPVFGPPGKGTFSETDYRDLVEYVRSLARELPGPKGDSR